MKSISLIIPVYNTADWIEKCMDNAVYQTMPFEEIVCIDDGSLDNSIEICERYKDKFSNVKVLSQENRGLGATRNRGIDVISSEYIFFLDSDDFLELDTVKRLQEILMGKEYDILYIEANTIYEEGVDFKSLEYTRKCSFEDEEVVSGRYYFKNAFPEGYFDSACMAVYRTNFLKDTHLRFPEGVLHEDNLFSFQAIMTAERVGYIHDKLYNRRIRAGSIMTSEYTDKRWLDLSFVIFKAFNFAIEHTDVYNDEKQVLFFIYKHESILRNSFMVQDTASKRQIIEEAVNDIDGLAKHKDGIFDDWDMHSLLHYFIIGNYLSKIGLRDKKYNDIARILNRKYMECLTELPLNKNKRVVIYGCGKHTDGLLNTYKMIVGDIRADIVYAQTNDTDAMYRGKPVVGINKIAFDDTDELIVSSHLYEEEMITNVSRLGKKIRVYSIYKDTPILGDIFAPLSDDDLLQSLVRL